jgi:hypothetical protein
MHVLKLPKIASSCSESPTGQSQNRHLLPQTLPMRKRDQTRQGHQNTLKLRKRNTKQFKKPRQKKLQQRKKKLQQRKPRKAK